MMQNRTQDSSEMMLELDITGETCPMTFVRTKLRLEKMADGDLLKIRMRQGDPATNVPRALRDHGHEVIAEENLADGLFALTVRKTTRRR